jgi:hypothetical protein
MAEVGTRFSGNLSLNIGYYAFVDYLTAVLVQEEPRGNVRSGSTAHVFANKRADERKSVIFAKKGTVPVLLVFFLATGFALNAIEIYWRLRSTLINGLLDVWCGQLCGVGLSCLAVGRRNVFCGGRSKTGIGLMLLLKTLLGAGLVLFSVSVKHGFSGWRLPASLLIYWRKRRGGEYVSKPLSACQPTSKHSLPFYLCAADRRSSCVTGRIFCQCAYNVPEHVAAGRNAFTVDSGTVGFFHKR